MRTAQEKTGRQQKPLVLVIEDETPQRDFLKEVLSRSGYECRCATNCAEGRIAMDGECFACVLIDLGLPDGNGLDLLAHLLQADPCAVPIILTGDARAERVIDTMRAGAFDYVTKPVDLTTLKAAVARALSHHLVVRERAELLRLLKEERDQLRTRVEAATADIRQYAAALNNSNTRLTALLRLTQLSNVTYYSDETLMRSVFEELRRHIPLRCVALCDVTRQSLLAVFRRHTTEEAEYLITPGDAVQAGYDSLLAEADPGLLVQEWVERNIGLDTSGLQSFAFPQKFWSRSICTVGFYLASEFTPDESEQEFLGMCAHFLAFEWEQAKLQLNAAHQASLGNIAVELARNFVQPLTAIATAADFITETPISPDAAEGMRIIKENSNLLKRQTQEFRKLSLLRENCVETVRLDEYVEQALSMLSVAIQNRNVTVEKEYLADCECVLINGTILARTFLDLILGALRSVDIGGHISLRLRELGQGYIAFEIRHAGLDQALAGPTNGSRSHGELGVLTSSPVRQLAERTIHSCGGKLSVEVDSNRQSLLRIVLPRNVTGPTVPRLAQW